MILKILGGFVLLLVVLGGVVHFQPNTYSVQRSATFAVAPAVVFGQVNDLAAWDGWSPWKKLDPNATMTLSKPSAGVDASLGWSGNDEVGEGKMTILASKPGELVELDQVFIRPFAGAARITFTFAPEGEGSKVTWKMAGENNFIGKAFSMVMNMDAMLGKDFEQGLANIKSVVEPGAARATTPAR